MDAVARACKNGTATRAEVLKELHKTNLKKSVFGDPIRFDAHGDRIRAHFFQFKITNKGSSPSVSPPSVVRPVERRAARFLCAFDVPRLVTVHSQPEPGFARREAHAREATSGRALRAAGSSTAPTTRDVLKEWAYGGARGSPVPNWDQFVQLTVNGLTDGAIYALIALGFSIVYGILRLLNFAQGDVFMIGAFIGYFVLTGFGGPASPDMPVPVLILLMFLFAMVGCGLLGVVSSASPTAPCGAHRGSRP